MASLSFEQAQQRVRELVRTPPDSISVENVPLLESPGRVLACDMAADRDLPPVDRSTRDGYAVRAEELPGRLRVVGETRAGQAAGLSILPGQAMEIMTGAPLPASANAVVMVEHTLKHPGWMETERTVEPGAFINKRASEMAAGNVVLRSGVRLNFVSIAMLASIGASHVPVYRRPEVAIVSTGDEITGIDDMPEPHQVRNSNAYSLAVQVEMAGGLPRMLGVARDTAASTRSLVKEGLNSDLLLLSGGVSAGKYDLVEAVLGELGAEFFFERVAIQPGAPLVFGSVLGKFFFGLPGNPASTMVTFALFASLAVRALGGERDVAVPLPYARLAQNFEHKTGLTRFLPARLSSDGSEITPVPWQGSSDIAALARSNALLVAEASRESWHTGDWIRCLRM